MPIARRVERRGAGLGDATDATNARASRRFSEDANARNDGKGNAPRCDSERQRGCEVRCELTGEGELVCEGIESGTYVVVNVADLDEACAVTFDGESIECEGAGEPLVSDTGDLDLKDSSQHGIRMGG